MLAIFLSVVLGIVIATLGAWKDTQWEPFSFKTYLRSPLLCFLWSIPLVFYFHAQSPILIALSAVSMERLTVEFWKGIFRKMPSKFKSEFRDTQWVKRRVRKNLYP